MQFSKTLSALAIYLLAASVSARPQGTDPDNETPGNPTENIEISKFATVVVGLATVQAPIVVPGGLRVVNTYGSGTINGGGLNGTIAGGFGAALVYNGGSAIDDSVYLYGQSDDNEPFFISTEASSNKTSVFDDINLEIDGRYAADSNEYLVGSVFLENDGKKATINVYKLKLKQ